VDTRIVTNHYSSWNLIIVGLAKIPTVAIPQSHMAQRSSMQPTKYIRKSTFPHMAQRSSMQSTKYIEQGKGQGSRKAEQPTIANSSVVYTTATMPYITYIVSISVF